LILLTPKFTLSTFFFDVYTHLHLSDFYLNNFFYLWTQFFILPSLLTYLLVAHNLKVLKNQNPILIFLKLYLLVSICLWVVDYYLINQYNYFLVSIPYFFNNLLTNPLNKYHPVMFFTSYLFLFSMSNFSNPFFSYKSFNSRVNTQQCNRFFIFKKLSIYILLLTVSLYLGSWWALQEGSWGGWWNWDASEVFGLLILTFLLHQVHYHSYYNSAVLNSLQLLYKVLSVIFTYLVLQMSYTLVSHNFGLSLLGYGYTNIVFIIFLIIVSVVYLFFTQKTFNFSQNNFYFKNST
jgi:cytochrome c biogenesis factor